MGFNWAHMHQRCCCTWHVPYSVCSYTVKSQWLEHWWLVYHGWLELIFESLWNSSDSSRKQIFRQIFIAPACSRVRYRRPIFCPSVRLSTFMSTFDIYVKVSILINYKTKQPSNFAWNISLTSWLCNIGIRFSVCLSIRPSVCQHLCRSSTFMSKLVF